MEKKFTFKKLLSGLLTTLLTLLGFAACSSDKEDPLVCMYAPLPSYYGIKGKVIEKDDADKAIAGIQVIAYPTYKSGEGEIKEVKGEADTLFTDANGRFLYESFYYPSVRIVFEDKNITEEGFFFENDTIDINLSELTREDVNAERKYEITVALQKWQAKLPVTGEKEDEEE